MTDIDLAVAALNAAALSVSGFNGSTPASHVAANAPQVTARAATFLRWLKENR